MMISTKRPQIVPLDRHCAQILFVSWKILTEPGMATDATLLVGADGYVRDPTTGVQYNKGRFLGKVSLFI